MDKLHTQFLQVQRKRRVAGSVLWVLGSTRLVAPLSNEFVYRETSLGPTVALPPSEGGCRTGEGGRGEEGKRE